MKSGFISLAMVAATLLVAAPESARASSSAEAQRVVALLDYVGGDYGRAVQDGRVVSDFEYEEQLRFVEDARAMAKELLPGGDPELMGHIDRLDEAVRRLATLEEVAVASRAARDAAVVRFGLPTAPTTRPSLERARDLYAQNCAACHGARGEADTMVAATLDPAPASFRDAERRRALSPYRVYNTLTFGVPGTAMASFDGLAADDRWSLAFYVFRMGHEGAPAAAGEAIPHVGLAELAARSDGELLKSHPAPAVAALRHTVPFEEPRAAAGLRHTREQVAAAVALYPTDPRGADRRVLDAYLGGFEPLEPQLSARDPRQVTELERAFFELRGAIAAGDDGAVQAAARRLDTALARADESGGGVVPFVAAFLIYFREGLEAALLVGALLAGVRRLGRPEAARVIHQGWVAAIAAGVATWWIAERLLAWSPLQRELVEAGVSLAAAAVLFSVSFWLISKAESRRWMDYLRNQLERSLSGRRLTVLGGLAFLAVYREAAETVLFTQALLLEENAGALQVGAGALTGLVAVLAAALVMNTTVRRLPIAPFFAVSSVLLCALAVSFAGSGMHALVAAGILQPRPVSVPDVPWMGIHPDLAPLVVQLAIVAVIVAGGISTLRRRGGEAVEG